MSHVTAGHISNHCASQGFVLSCLTIQSSSAPWSDLSDPSVSWCDHISLSIFLSERFIWELKWILFLNTCTYKQINRPRRKQSLLAWILSNLSRGHWWPISCIFQQAWAPLFPRWANAWWEGHELWWGDTCCCLDWATESSAWYWPIIY